MNRPIINVDQVIIRSTKRIVNDINRGNRRFLAKKLSNMKARKAEAQIRSLRIYGDMLLSKAHISSEIYKQEQRRRNANARMLMDNLHGW